MGMIDLLAISILHDPCGTFLVTKKIWKLIFFIDLKFESRLSFLNCSLLASLPNTQLSPPKDLDLCKRNIIYLLNKTAISLAHITYILDPQQETRAHFIIIIYGRQRLTGSCENENRKVVMDMAKIHKQLRW